MLTEALLHRFMKVKYGQALSHAALEPASAQPHATIDGSVYLPPALKPGCVGWFPQGGRAWIGYGMPRYSF